VVAACASSPPPRTRSPCAPSSPAFGFGKLYRRTDNREQVHEHLATATTMYREMDMRFWLEKVDLAEPS
jgi:hypothetical protein